MIHPTAIVSTTNIGPRTSIWQFCVISEGTTIGADCNICSHCFIETGVTIGDRVTLKNGVHLWTGLHVEDDVFIGPNATFCNDRNPRSKRRPISYEKTRIHAGASIGAGAVVLPGISIGRNSLVGAGAVVTRNVPANAVVAGNPAKIINFTDATNPRLSKRSDAIVPNDNTALSKSRSENRETILKEFNKFVDERGELTACSLAQHVPFTVRRLFFVSKVPARIARGSHAHRICHQFLICTHGHVDVALDNGFAVSVTRLDSPNKGLHVPPLVWGVQYNYSHDACLLVLASHEYDPTDYIDCYDQFKALVKNL
jgi:acetyltransferase-like isoleucine patch superfamily enzyme/dTDP-4-dehydrorhamnose 3,5-epimerase-like enzyme